MPRTLFERLLNRTALFDRRHVVTTCPNEPVATFTFDDFPSSAYDIGGRILEAANVRGTYFVSGGLMGSTICDVKYYEEKQLKAAYAAGHEIGCHSFMHKKLSIRGPSYARKTCDKNAQFIHDILGPQAAMTSFAYPFGDASIRVKHMMARRFEACRSVREAVNSGTVDRAHINITSLENRHISRLDLVRIITEAKAHNGWIVFLTHDVAERPSPYGATPAMIEKTLRSVTDAGIKILPFKTAAAYVFSKKL